MDKKENKDANRAKLLEFMHKKIQKTIKEKKKKKS